MKHNVPKVPPVDRDGARKAAAKLARGWTR